MTILLSLAIGIAIGAGAQAIANRRYLKRIVGSTAEIDAANRQFGQLMREMERDRP